MTPRLVLTGLVAGIFATVFGVGGGTIIVPLLVLFGPYAPRVAAATSLGAILVTAAAGVVFYAVQGEVDVAYAALVGIPAMAGALLGTHLQQGVSGQALSLAFSLFLAGIGIWLIAG